MGKGRKCDKRTRIKGCALGGRGEQGEIRVGKWNKTKKENELETINLRK